MTTPEPATARSGLAFVLVATAIAGAIGYVIQAVVPALTSRADYVSFSVYWSAVYLVVAAIGGVQQEITRAARPRGESPSAAPTVVRFGLGAAGVFAVAVLATALFWAPEAFGQRSAQLVPPLVAAACGYALVAVLSGVFYGARRWRAVAGMTVTDAALRLVAIMAALALGGGFVALGWAVALPFTAALAVLWIVSGRRAVREIAIDTSMGGLIGHSLSTVGAALATGVMISGLPLLLGMAARSLGEAHLASLILVITLTRAPLVIPLLALQSYLVVVFRDTPERAVVRTLRWSASLLALTAVLSFAGALVGPAVIELLYGDRYLLEPAVYAAVIASAGLTALLCLTGPAALASGHHGRYVGGWAVASSSLILALIVAPSGVWGVMVPLLVAPFLGAVVHLTSLPKSRATR